MAQLDKCLPANLVYEQNNAEFYLATWLLCTVVAIEHLKNGEFKHNVESALFLTKNLTCFNLILFMIILRLHECSQIL